MKTNNTRSIATSKLERISGKKGFSQHLTKRSKIDESLFFQVGRAWHININTITISQILDILQSFDDVAQAKIELVENTLNELLLGTTEAAVMTENKHTIPSKASEKSSTDNEEASTKPNYSDLFVQRTVSDDTVVIEEKKVAETALNLELEQLTEALALLEEKFEQQPKANTYITTQIDKLNTQVIELQGTIELQKQEIETISFDAIPNEEVIVAKAAKWSSDTYRKATIAVCLAITIVSTFMVFLHNGFNAYSFFFALFFNLLFVMITLISIASMQEKGQSQEQIMIAKGVSFVFATAEIYMHYRCFSASLDADVIGSVTAFSAFMSFIIAGANLSALLGLKSQSDNDNKVA